MRNEFTNNSNNDFNYEVLQRITAIETNINIILEERPKVQEEIAKLELKELVTNEIIEPLVLMWSGITAGPYYFSNLLNIYDGGSTSGNYPTMYLYFILTKGHKINNLSMYSSTNTATSYAEG